MPPQQLTLADYHANDGGGMGVYGQAVKEIPSAAVELAGEAWQHPGQAIGHAAKTVVEAGVMGTAIGYIVPARGPASMIVGAVLTAPAVYHAVNRLAAAQEATRNPLADQQAIAHALARDTITGTTDLGLSFAGGYAGAELGYAMAGSKGAIGRFSQVTQRGIMHVENKGMAWARGVWEGGSGGPKGGGLLPKIDIYNGVPRAPGSSAAELVKAPITSDAAAAIARSVRPSVAPEQLPFIQRRLGILNRRVDQAFAEPATGYQIYKGPLHGHSRYSDGMLTPETLYAKGKEEGLDFMAITDHNHPAARGGVKPDDIRAKDQAGTPTVAEDPTLYTQTFQDAAAATDKNFVGLVGVELGTIGKVGGGHNHEDLFGPSPETPTVARETSSSIKPPEPTPAKPPEPQPRIDIEVKPTLGPQGKPEGILPTVNEPVGPVGQLPPGNPPETLGRETGDAGSLSADAAANAKHLGGVNHINVFEMPQFIESIRETHGNGLVAMPEVWKINDGNYRALADKLDGQKDSTGGTPVIQLNHPRFKADESPNTPAADRGRDYGQKSFKSHQEWLDRFATPYVRQIEIMKGGALHNGPVDTVPSSAIDATSFAGYIDKGVHASPTFGRDFHYGDPAGTPGTTGIMAKSLDKVSLMDALRERRTIATTSGEKLTGSMWGNDSHPMGSILDQAAVPDLTLSAQIGGEVVPDATYKIKLWGDTKLGDKKLADIVQETEMTGAELLAANNKVSFDPLEHKLGNKSAYWMEIQRTDPTTGNVDRMFTAPIWVEPLTGDKHSFYMRWLTGNSAQFLEGLVRRK